MAARRVASGAKVKAWRFGKLGEALAAGLLRLKGYRILERRLRGPRGGAAGELDLIARRGRVLAFVEVKARNTIEEAVSALSVRQRRRIAHAASGYLARRPELSDLHIRFDIVVINRRGIPQHIADAWRPD